MADPLQIPAELRKSAPENSVTVQSSAAALSSTVSRLVRRKKKHADNGPDTFTRTVPSSLVQLPTRDAAAANETFESQILPLLDLDRLQPANRPIKRRFGSRALMYLLIAGAFAAPTTYYFSAQASHARWQTVRDWLQSSIRAEPISDSLPQQQLGFDQSKTNAATLAAAEAEPRLPSNEAAPNDTTNNTTAVVQVGAPTPQQDDQSKNAKSNQANIDAAPSQNSTRSPVALASAAASGDDQPSAGVTRTSLPPNLEQQPTSLIGGGRPALDAATIELLLKQGRHFLASGDFVGARTMFLRAAEAGNATAALELGATYDPVEFTVLRVRGIGADIDKARSWYEVAQRLGSAEAPRRLEALAIR